MEEFSHSTPNLFEFASCQIKLHYPNIPSSSFTELQYYFQDFINGKIDYPTISYYCLHHVGSSNIADMIYSIMTNKDEPISPLLTKTILQSDRKKPRSWTKAEDARLLMAIHIYGLNNWTACSKYVGSGRTSM